MRQLSVDAFQTLIDNELPLVRLFGIRTQEIGHGNATLRMHFNPDLIRPGGTIAGRADSTMNLTDYKAGALAGSELVDAVPELKQYAEISVEQIANIRQREARLLVGVVVVTPFGNLHWRWLESYGFTGL